MSVEPSQVPTLQRRITVDLNDIPLREALRRISLLSGLQFAYANSVIASDRLVRLKASEISVADALTALLRDASIQIVLHPGGGAVLQPAIISRAQSVRGVVFFPDSSRASGVIVIVADERGKTAARALTGERGEFEAHLPDTGRYDFRFLRIGFKPTVVPAIDIMDGQPRSLTIVMRGESVVLSSVTVRGKNDCSVRQDSGQQVAAMWEEARKAITATELSPSGAKQTVRWTTYDRATDLSGDIVLTEKSDRFSAAAMKAFVSLSPDSLATLGYMSEEATGTVYRAPDAEALLSDAFASFHCFHAEPPPNDHDDWVGVGFRPAKNRGQTVDIEGTLWLDRTSSELRLLEYKYTNLPEDYSHAQAGGRVEFIRLSTGGWLVGRWEIRMPRALLRYVPRFTGQLGARDEIKSVVEGLQFTGGEVTEVLRGPEVLFSSGQSRNEFAPHPVNDDARLAVTCGADSANGDWLALLRGTVVEGAHTPVAGASVTVTWRSQFRPAGQGAFKYQAEERDLVSDESGAWFLCGVPRERLITVRARAGSRASAAATIRIARDRTSAGLDIGLPPLFRQ